MKAREKEVAAKRSVRLSLIPILLYLTFMLGTVAYVYSRVRFGMGGLTLPLIIYSYILLVVELLGVMNMLFYGCWLLAKPVNDDVFPKSEKVRARGHRK
jgi:hypothetical protein